MTIPLSISVDPWSLTLISVSVVFGALIILFALYSLSGAIFTGKLKRRPGKGKADKETAAAIAMALDRYAAEGGGEPAAIALALHLYLSGGVHDLEPGFITIRQSDDSGWRNKALTFRKKA